jgi:hypothetical protein
MGIILAIDLWKFNSVFGGFDPLTGEVEFRTPAAMRAAARMTALQPRSTGLKFESRGHLARIVCHLMRFGSRVHRADAFATRKAVAASGRGVGLRPHAAGRAAGE